MTRRGVESGRRKKPAREAAVLRQVAKHALAAIGAVGNDVKTPVFPAVEK